MAYVADLHIHSRFSRACSSQISIPNLAKWAKVKGIDLLGTGDFLHPLWQAEMKSTFEIACIYSDQGKARRIHLLVVLPSWDSLMRLTQEFTRRKVNISSDGRPITGFSSRQLCEIARKASTTTPGTETAGWSMGQRSLKAGGRSALSAVVG